MGEVILPAITSPRTSPLPHPLKLAEGRDVSANDTDDGRDVVSLSRLPDVFGAATGSGAFGGASGTSSFCGSALTSCLTAEPVFISSSAWDSASFPSQ